MNDIHPYKNEVKPPLDAVIAISTAQSAAINLEGHVLCGIYTPVVSDGSRLTFLACDTQNGTFVPVKTATGVDVEAAMQTGAAEYISIDPSVFAGVVWLKIQSNATETAARSFKLSVRDIA